MTPVLRPSEMDGFSNAPEGSERYGATITPLSDVMGTRGLAAMAVTIAPGRRAFPFHNHLGNDEVFVVTAGSGIYRYGAAEHPVAAGDMCLAPQGGPDTAHQLVAGPDGLSYLGISTRNDPDIVEQPDSGKFAALAIAPGTSFFDAHLQFVGRRADTGDYWEGEA
jgi:uncharacterized cupin superfamily protein